jgi:hypothetical protein
MLRTALDDVVLYSEEEREILRTMMEDSAEYLHNFNSQPDDATYEDQMSILHSVCDNLVARHSVAMAFQVCFNVRSPCIQLMLLCGCYSSSNYHNSSTPFHKNSR